MYPKSWGRTPCVKHKQERHTTPVLRFGTISLMMPNRISGHLAVCCTSSSTSSHHSGQEIWKDCTRRSQGDTTHASIKYTRMTFPTCWRTWSKSTPTSDSPLVMMVPSRLDPGVAGSPRSPEKGEGNRAWGEVYFIENHQINQEHQLSHWKIAQT